MEEISLFISILALMISISFALFGGKVKEYSEILSRSRTFKPLIFTGHTNPPKPPFDSRAWKGFFSTAGPVNIQPLDHWIRDGRLPHPLGGFILCLVILELEKKRVEGFGLYQEEHKAWKVWLPGYWFEPQKVKRVDAWQKFPDYETI